MIASRSGTRRGFESESAGESNRGLRANIPLQTMAIKITTEVDHDADSTNQRGTERSSPEFKGPTLHDEARADVQRDLKYAQAMSLEDSLA